MSKSVVRSVKNVTKGYSRVEKKVRDATSNDAWGPTGTEMQEIAQLTFNSSTDFFEIMSMLDKRLNDKGKSWRHVLKSLKVLDYCLHEGSEVVVTWARKNVYIIKTLREFQHIDDAGNDVGQNVRVSAKELTSLILDEERLRAERRDRKLWKSRVTGLDDYGTSGGFGGGNGSPTTERPQRKRNQRPQREDEDDLEYRLAIEASKNQEEEDRKNREGRGGRGADEDDLARAIKLSKEEEDLRRRELEEQNAASLFDDLPAPSNQPQITGWNQGYHQQPAVDFSGNLIDVQPQQQNNGFYGQPNQQQQTGFQNGFGYNPYQQQPQQTGFNNFQQQQQQPSQFMQPQQTAFNMNNPYSQFANQNQMQQQQQQQQPAVQQPGSNNPWASQGGSMDDLKPQPTGSNNPFASSFNRPQTAQPQRAPTLSTLQEQQTATQFNPMPSMSFQATNRPQTSHKEQDPHLSNLNQLLSTGEGQDTFGNVGNLRIPAQHTAPGTFVNSAGAGLNRLNANQTGNNPFMQSQFTGMPQQTGFMAPAQTGPAGAFGSPFGSANPYGGGMQQQQQRQQGGSLIDL